MFSFSVIEKYLDDSSLKFRIGGTSTDFGHELDTYVDADVGLDFIDVSKPNEEGVLIGIRLVIASDDGLYSTNLTEIRVDEDWGMGETKYTLKRINKQLKYLSNQPDFVSEIRNKFGDPGYYLIAEIRNAIKALRDMKLEKIHQELLCVVNSLECDKDAYTNRNNLY